MMSFNSEVPSKRWEMLIKVHGVTFQKSRIINKTIMETSNLAFSKSSEQRVFPSFQGESAPGDMVDQC